VEQCLAYCPDALIAGETDDYTMRAAADLGVSLIETSHAESENPGLRHFASMLQSEFAGVPVQFIECQRPWKTM
jgi:putative NIF3 family GTP cyclohydrolase 1 type 2